MANVIEHESSEPSDQEIMEAVRQHEAQELEHVMTLAARVDALMPEVEKLIAEERRRSIRREPTIDDKIQMVREHAVRRYYDRHLRMPAALPPGNLAADTDERTGPEDMQGFANWYKARRTET